LLAVLWFDLMFDVQVWPHWGTATLPEDVLASISTYYQRVTIDAAPMKLLVGGIMFLTIAAVLWNFVNRQQALWVRISTFILLSIPVAAAQLVIFPNAQLLAARAGDLATQTGLANGIFVAHVACFIAILLLIMLQFLPHQKSD